MVQPVIHQEGQLLKMVQGKHPVISQIIGGTFVPNDLELNGELFLISGPNMGGKSTFLRQVAQLCILGQLGCNVPAEHFEFSVVDRIFTRLGANDRPYEQKSTFYVEMEEAGQAVNHPSPNSLIIMDELGRGTSTNDGISIAMTIVKEMAARQCRVLFTTHYQPLLQIFKGVGNIQCYHLGFILDGDQVNFLYTLVKGICPQSFAFNVARMAGLPELIVEQARQYQNTSQFKKEQQGLFGNKSKEEFSNLLNDIIGDS